MAIDVNTYIQNYFPNQNIESQSQMLGIWKEWYTGKVEKFHNYTIYNGVNDIKREKKSLKMAKKCCEDWANLLLNDKCSINIKDQDMLDTVLEDNDFLHQANELIEESFALSIGAIVESLTNLAVTDKGVVIKTKDSKVKLDYVNATKIYPITFNNQEIVECAFVSVNTNTTEISIHKLNEKQEYDVINLVISTQVDGNNLVSESIFHTLSKEPLYQIIKPSISNNIDIDSPLGISVFANAIDELKAIDNSYDALDTEIEIGRKRIFIDSRLCTKVVNDKVVNAFDPNDAAYYMLPDSMNPEAGKNPIIETSSPLRVLELTTALQENLNTFAATVGFGKNYYTFGANGGGRPINTATGIIAQNSDLFRNIKKHEKLLRNALTNMVKVIAHLINTFTLDTMNYEDIVVNFDDSIIEDTESQKASDRTDVTNGVMSKVEYRVKWYGEDEDTAKENLEKFSLNDLDTRLNALNGALTSGAIDPKTFVNEVYKNVDETTKTALVDYITATIDTSSEPISFDALGIGNE